MAVRRSGAAAATQAAAAGAAAGQELRARQDETGRLVRQQLQDQELPRGVRFAAEKVHRRGCVRQVRRSPVHAQLPADGRRTLLRHARQRLQILSVF